MFVIDTGVCVCVCVFIFLSLTLWFVSLSGVVFDPVETLGMFAFESFYPKCFQFF